MVSISRLRVIVQVAALAVIGLGVTTAGAQSAATRQVTVVVMPFEFAAPVTQQPRVAPPHRPSMWPPVYVRPSFVGSMSTAGTSPSVQLAHGASSSSASKEAGDGLRSENAIGVGVADLLVERLLQVPGIRVIERRRLDLVASERRLAAEDSGRLRGTTRDGSSAPLLQARYIITGSVTRFGTEERRGLGGLGGGFGLGALGIKRPKTQVALTARVIDATTGEIMASMTGTGVSTKGGAVLVGGIGGGVGGGVAITSSEFRASALGEATDRAITALVEQLAAQRARWQ